MAVLETCGEKTEDAQIKIKKSCRFNSLFCMLNKLPYFQRFVRIFEPAIESGEKRRSIK